MFKKHPQPTEPDSYSQPGTDTTWTDLSYHFPAAVLVSGQIHGALCTKCRNEIRNLTWSILHGTVYVLNRRGLCDDCSKKAS